MNQLAALLQAPPAPFEIATNADTGARTGSNGTNQLVLLESDGKMFRRRAVKYDAATGGRNVEWIVGVLDGVSVYFDGVNVVMTRRDMLP